MDTDSKEQIKKLTLESINLNGCIALLGAVIRQAIDDLNDPKGRIRETAEAFLISKRYRDLCGFCEANPQYILENANRLGGGIWIMPSIIRKISN